MMAPGKKRKADPKDKEVAQGAAKRRQSVNRALQRASRSLSRVTRGTSNWSVDDDIGRVNEQRNFTSRTRKNVSSQQTDDTDFSDSDLEQPVGRGRRRGTNDTRQIALGTVNRNSVESKSKEKGTSSVRRCQSAPGTAREKRGQINNKQNKSTGRGQKRASGEKSVSPGSGNADVSDSEHSNETPKSGPLLRIPTYETDSDETDTEEMQMPSMVEEMDNDLSDNELSNAAQAHVNFLTGGQPQSIHSTIFAKPISVPISSQISSRIKRKIWANKYVDFGSLLPSYSMQPKQQKFTLQLSNDSTFNLIPQAHTRKITSIAQWSSAFLRFVAVYTEKAPKEAPQLMKYGEIIRDLAYRRPGLAWYYYDTQFRQLRESVAYRWDMIYYDLWVPAATSLFQNFSRQRQQSNPAFQKQSSPFLRNCCWAYNRSGCTRTECKFPHTCGICKGSHPAKDCKQPQITGRPDSQGQQGGYQPSGPRPGQDGPNQRPRRR